MTNKCFLQLIKVGLLYCLILCLACDNNSDNRQEDQREEQPTNAVEMNTSWKLVALVETGNNIKIPEELIKSPKAYTLLFKEDGSYEGYTNVNKIK